MPLLPSLFTETLDPLGDPTTLSWFKTPSPNQGYLFWSTRSLAEAALIAPSRVSYRFLSEYLEIQIRYCPWQMYLRYGTVTQNCCIGRYRWYCNADTPQPCLAWTTESYLNGCDWRVKLDFEEYPVGPDGGGDNVDFEFSSSLLLVKVLDALDV